ncbi:hypothetical protein AB25_1687 [Escherichia coli 2-005-03_S1_C2]|nr:hypothetical protein CSC24_3914 [Escherichia coli]EFW54710.1 hypothetical protein SGB_03084 [Shigella boydii ATCC 9905]EGI99940.1 hypothetical protein SD15574_1624 [Shigella dysenteriae 155-74]EGK24721.1 hypothetical protein SFVA6_1920 [Shigella flexneri VA-6]EIE54751.1 hypothetical protein ECAI27_31240 [Escherichia coli AI27]EIQ13014.1 hypothetical protein SFK1770_2420 [Shigella flexneri K-1770]EIQ64474.1 hypothetical protein ECEPECA12_1835 [Escherichia coli EPECa12]EMU71534.1 hypothetic
MLNIFFVAELVFKDVRHSSSHIMVLSASIKSFKTSFT